MLKKTSSCAVLICCPLVLCALIAPLPADADCSFQAGYSTPQSVFENACMQKGGVPHGCSCDAPSSGSSGSAPIAGGGVNGALMQGASSLGYAIGTKIRESIVGSPEQDAETARINEDIARYNAQQKQAYEARRAREALEQERARQRILGLLKGSDASPGLSLKTDDDEPPLAVAETPGSLGSKVLTPIGTNSPPALQGLQLKLNDDPDPSNSKASNSMESKQGFDTNGKALALPARPPVPNSSPPPDKTQLVNDLKAKLEQNEAEEESLNDQLVQLQQAPTPDPVAISQVQEKIAVKEAEKKKIMLDLTADDTDAPATGQPSSSTVPDAAPSGGPASGEQP